MSRTPAGPGSTWEHVPGRHVALRTGSVEVVRVNVGGPAGTGSIHPLRTPRGTELTWSEPPDHPWHRGLWFSWVHVDGLDYWLHPDGMTYGAQDPSGAGAVRALGPEEVELGDGEARIRERFRYAAGPGRSLEERRERTVAVPDASGWLRIDETHVVAAEGGPVVLSGFPLTEDEPWGGFAGLTWRAGPAVRRLRALDSEGRKDAAVSGARARWADLSGETDDDGPVGVAILDHPSNPRHPSSWKVFVDDGFGFLNPSLTLTGPYVVEPGVALTLRYRVLVHPGPADASRLEAEYRRFATPAG